MRALGSLLVLGLAGCDSPDADVTYANEIVFSIEQRVDAATGKPRISADYEYLSLARVGGSVTYVFRDGDGDGTCYFERYDGRLGRPHVENGLATWTGGPLPAEGLSVLANEPAPPTFDGGWTDQDTLAFQVSGFAMPPILRVTMNAPRTALDITAITPAADIKPTDEVGVAWTPPAADDGLTHVMVTLDTDEDGSRGGGVRCFAYASTGHVKIPAEWVSRLYGSVDPAKPIKGRIGVSSHRQVTYLTRGEWVVYIVATTLHREQPFTGSR